MNRIKVAVIDSGVNLHDTVLHKRNIEAIKIENRICQSWEADSNGHGTDVVKIISGQTEAAAILSIQILNHCNKGSIDDLCEAIQYCVRKGVDVINLSLGMNMKCAEQIKRLKQCCDFAVESGVVLISSNHNHDHSELDSYPFAFSNIIGVQCSAGLGTTIKVDREQNNIVFNGSIVSVPDNERVILRKGNSFITPMVTGLWCEYRKEQAGDFFSYLEQIQEISTKIFFNKNDEQSYEQFSSKKVGYFYLKKSSNDMNVINQLKRYATVLPLSINEKIDFFEICKIDFLFFGEISKGEYNNCLVNVLDLTETAAAHGVNIVMMVPFMSISQRLKFFGKYNVSVQSIYF
ncbi:S8 family serine peptidase [Paenibacillus sp. FSL H7-0350]|uniref:S8 family serine peptidase n=1 Tax=Paenibacillus sp. FSL H7-0350 TaxID=2975345 RepID=UPI003159304A